MAARLRPAIPPLRSGKGRSELPAWRGDRYPARLRAPGFDLLPGLRRAIEVALGQSNRFRPVLVDLAFEPDDGPEWEFCLRGQVVAADGRSAERRRRLGGHVARLWRFFVLGVAADTLHGLEAVALQVQHAVLKARAGAAGELLRATPDCSQTAGLAPVVDTARALLARLLTGFREQALEWHYDRHGVSAGTRTALRLQGELGRLCRLRADSPPGATGLSLDAEESLFFLEEALQAVWLKLHDPEQRPWEQLTPWARRPADEPVVRYVFHAAGGPSGRELEPEAEEPPEEWEDAEWYQEQDVEEEADAGALEAGAYHWVAQPAEEPVEDVDPVLAQLTAEADAAAAAVEEREQLLAERACFFCQERGHVKRHCPARKAHELARAGWQERVARAEAAGYAPPPQPSRLDAVASTRHAAPKHGPW